MNRKLIKLFWSLLIIILMLIIENFTDNPLQPEYNSTQNLQTNTQTKASSEQIFISEFSAPVKRVVDGDTFVYTRAGRDHTVRLIGIDTPEIRDPRKPVQCFGQEASTKTKELIEGKVVYFQKDSHQTLDKYKRELWNVYLEDRTFVNKTLVAEGYAFATPQYESDYIEEFVNLEKEARIQGKGLWNESICKYQN